MSWVYKVTIKMHNTCMLACKESGHLQTVCTIAALIEGLRSKTELKRFLISGNIRTLKNNCTMNLKYDAYTHL